MSVGVVPNGTKRKCGGGDHQVKFEDGTWFHMAKDDWTDKPHKASPRKYKRKGKR